MFNAVLTQTVSVIIYITHCAYTTHLIACSVHLYNLLLQSSSPSLKQHLEIKRTSLKRELKRAKNGETKIKREIDSIQEQLQDIVTDGSRGLLYPLLFCLLLGFTVSAKNNLYGMHK